MSTAHLQQLESEKTAHSASRVIAESQSQDITTQVPGVPLFLKARTQAETDSSTQTRSTASVESESAGQVKIVREQDQGEEGDSSRKKQPVSDKEAKHAHPDGGTEEEQAESGVIEDKEPGVEGRAEEQEKEQGENSELQPSPETEDGEGNEATGNETQPIGNTEEGEAPKVAETENPEGNQQAEEDGQSDTGTTQSADDTNELGGGSTGGAEGANVEQEESQGSEESETTTEEGQSATQYPLAGLAADHLAEIDNNAAVNQVLLRSAAQQNRQRLRGYFTAKRADAAEYITGHIQKVTGVIHQKRAEVSGWLTSRMTAIQSTVFLVVTRAVSLGTQVTGRIQSGAASLGSRVSGAVNGVIARVLRVARSLPIPSIPGLGRIRNAVLGAAERIAGTVRRVLDNIVGFIQRVVSSVLELVQSLLSRISQRIMNIAIRITAIILRAIAVINSRFGWLLQRLVAAIRAIANRIYAVLDRLERIAIGQFNRREAIARREIEANRRRARRTIIQIIMFCYERGDYPADREVHGPLETVDNTSSKEEFESAASAAMIMALHLMRVKNGDAVLMFINDTASMTRYFITRINTFLISIWLRFSRSYVQLTLRVVQVVNQLRQVILLTVRAIINSVSSILRMLSSTFSRVVQTIYAIIRSPVDRMINITGRVLSRVRQLLGQIISRLIRALTTGSGADTDTSSVIRFFDSFRPSRLAAAARMASPPAAAGAIVIGGGLAVSGAAAATLALLAKILFWVGVVLLIIMVLYLLYRAIVWYMSRPRAVPRAPAKPRAKPRVRRKPRRRRQPKKPLFWNPSLTYGNVVATGGIPGTLDTTAKLPSSAPLHGHHVWPKYVGGPSAQPLMSIRDRVHLGIVHPTIYPPIAATAATMGFTVLPNSTNHNLIAHLRSNIGDRTVFMTMLTGYYVGLNAITHPTIPPPAYTTGLVSSFPRI